MNLIRTLLKKNADFWTEDRSLTALLLYLVVYVFILPPMILSRAGEIINAIIFSMILVSGVFAMATKTHLKILIVMLASVTTAIHWLDLINQSIDLRIVDILFSMISWSAFACLVLWHVFKEGFVSVHRIQGAIAVYVLIGLIWSSAYQLIGSLDPQAFYFPLADGSPDHTQMQFVYFSYETLTTLGFGDIIPINPVAKSLVMVEGLTGQLFPAIMITRLVSLEIESRRTRNL